jgi:protein ImuA
VKLISCQNGRILTSLKSEETFAASDKIVPTRLDALDEIAPEGGFEQGAIHEILSSPEHGTARTFALNLARTIPEKGAIIWCDDTSDLYPPAIASSGIPLDRLYLLRPEKRDDLIWAITECLRCKGVAVTIAQVNHLSRIEARRLQLAAERGGGMGLLLRPMLQIRGEVQAPQVYAAATRWLVEPAQGERTVQRWNVQLIHGHGGRVGKPVILEHNRETNLMRAVEKLADRPVETLVRTVG